MVRSKYLAALVQLPECSLRVRPRLPLPTENNMYSHIIVDLETKIDCWFMRRKYTALRGD